MSLDVLLEYLDSYMSVDNELKSIKKKVDKLKIVKEKRKKKIYDFMIRHEMSSFNKINISKFAPKKQNKGGKKVEKINTQYDENTYFIQI